MRETRADPLPAHDLAAFVAAVERGSIHAAADALSLTQSAVTKRVHSLERRLGAVLLERDRFGVHPTPAGKALHPLALRALRAIDAAERAVLVELEDESRALRLAASHTIGEFLLPRWLAEFGQPPTLVHPQVEIVHSPGVVDAVRRGNAEIGFVEFDESLDDLETLTISADEIVVVVSAAHRWAGRETLVAAELESEPFLTRELGSGTRSVALGRLAAKGVVLRPSYEAASTEGLKRAVLSGGFTLISRLTAEQEERLGTLRIVRVADVDLTRKLRAIREPGGSAGPGASFWPWLARHARGAAKATPADSPMRSFAL